MANDMIDLEELYRSYFPKIYNFFFISFCTGRTLRTLRLRPF